MFFLARFFVFISEINEKNFFFKDPIKYFHPVSELQEKARVARVKVSSNQLGSVVIILEEQLISVVLTPC